MKALEKNISRHENGTLYFVARRGGKLVVRSLGTKILEEAEQKVREKGVSGFFATDSKNPPINKPPSLEATAICLSMGPTSRRSW